jgi:hypothetical protein
MIQLPNDVINAGVQQVRPFHFEQVFYSKEHSFKGTEKDFVRAGLGYEYSHDSNFKRYGLTV